ncbi:MAG: BtaA family protein [Myxococcales bacterium]|nr:BtaA family protein [Myxococcales bacterium]MDH3842455.1 BtaA family protein [Myxococcales bacterium]
MTAAATVWERGRFDARVGPSEVLFGRMYEDASIELDAFHPGSRIFCIASAGCTAMKLAPDHEVVAVDINPIQLAYANRRFEGDAGFRGKAERVMDFARFFGPLAGWWPSQVRAFLELDDPVEQIECWQRELNTWRFRTAVDGLFSVTALRSVYAPRFLDFLPKRLGAVMRGRMERCFERHPNSKNPYARSLLLGELSSDPPPPEAKNIRLVHADAASFLENEPPGSFDGFTLSNILDGVEDAYRQRLFAAVKRAAAPEAVTVLRSFGDAGASSPENRAADDRAMLWGSVLVRPVRAF